jgi:hypothetical protein
VALEVRGQPILSQGELMSLMRGLSPQSRSNGVLAAWFAGHEPRPASLYAALDIDTRLDAETPLAEAIIDSALGRLERAFPDLVV